MRHTHYFLEKSKGTKLGISIFLNFIIAFAEVAGGIWAGSLSLISDALHNFSDVTSLVISYIAVRLVHRKHTEEHTFGYKRAEIIAALFNASLLVIISFFLFKEAIIRFQKPVIVNSVLVIWIAFIGLIANAGSVILLKKDAHKDLNIRSAYLHLFSDTLSSVAVIIGGVCIYLFKVYWLDPLLTIFIGLYVLRAGFRLVGESVHILMQHTPKEVNLKDIQRAIEHIRGVKDIHHVHAWAISAGDIHFEAHINVTTDMKLSESCLLKAEIENLLKEKFSINHTTLQFEYDMCKGVALIPSAEIPGP
jgi:cobalt-zinc-cadmium efflux system protein